MNKLVINGRFLSRRVTGVDRYAREIIRELDSLVDENEAVLVIPNEAEIVTPLRLNKIKTIRYGNRRGYAWEQIDFARYIRESKGTGLNLCNTAPVLNPGVVCIHDMNIRRHPEYFSSNFVLAYRVLFSILSRSARTVLTVSNFSKDELEHYYPIAVKKTAVAPCAWQHITRINSDSAVLTKWGLEAGSYYFAMSSLAPNKNLRWIVESAQLNPKSIVAVAGGINRAVFGDHKYPNTKNVKYLGYVSDGEAKALMENCRGFLFPTFYEGFGIPPMEALACGARIAVSDTQTMHEVYGLSAHYVDPLVPCGDLDGLFSECVAAPSEVLNRYSWRSSAELILNAAMRHE